MMASRANLRLSNARYLSALPTKSRDVA
jgi:hypothetical protein